MKKTLSNLPIWVILLAVMGLFTLVFFNIYIVPILPLVLGVFVYFFTKTERTIIKKKSTPINQLVEGLMKIEGKIVATNHLETPFFKEECIGYNYEKAEIDYDDETGNEYTKSAILKNDFLSFYISDATGKIKINSENLDLSFLPKRTKVISKTRHTERSLKNGDEITILGTVVKNSQNEFELQKVSKNPFTASNKIAISKQQKAFRAINFTLPYFILMYIGVNYFLFTPLQIHIKENEIFPYFAIFGIPILAVIFGIIGSRFDGFTNLILSNLAGNLFIVALLTIPLLCLFYIIELEFYRIFCIWLIILVYTSLAFVINYKKLDEIFEKDKYTEK